MNHPFRCLLLSLCGAALAVLNTPAAQNLVIEKGFDPTKAVPISLNGFSG